MRLRRYSDSVCQRAITRDASGAERCDTGDIPVQSDHAELCLVIYNHFKC